MGLQQSIAVWWRENIEIPMTSVWETGVLTPAVKTTNLTLDILGWIMAILGFVVVVIVLVGGLFLLKQAQEIVRI
jgi:hypothetical protein